MNPDEQQIRELVGTWMSATKQGDLACLWSKLSVDVTMPDGKVTRRAGHTLSVFRKRGGRWQLARDANLPTPVSI